MLEKPAYNEEFRTLDFSLQLAAGETISSATVTIVDNSTGSDCSADMIASVAPYNSTMVKYTLKGGTTGQVYLRTFRITTSTGQKLEERVALRVV